MAEIQIEQPNAEERKQFDEFRRDHKDDKVGPIATNVLFEDDHVKVWGHDPGARRETAICTRTRNDYYLVMLQGDKVCGISKDGTNDLVFNLTPGAHTFRIPKGATEWAVNTGQGALLRDPGRDQGVARELAVKGGSGHPHEACQVPV